MVHVGGGVTDYVKMLQQKTLAVIHPLAGISCLNKHEYGFPGLIFKKKYNLPTYTIVVYH